MIKNERQYRITKTQLDELTQMLSEVLQQPIVNERFQRLEAEGLRTQISDLRAQIEEYDSLVAGEQPILTLESFEELPQALIKARIAAGLSQKDLAERLGLKEQQIQRYEATDYASASLDRVQEVVRALSIRVREDIILPKAELSLRRLLTRLSRAGLDSAFVFSRLIPRALRTRMEDPDDPGDPDMLILAAASTIGRIFGWTNAQVFGNGKLQPSLAVVDVTRYKTAGRVDVEKTNSYTIYAHYLAQQVLAATIGLPTRSIPRDPHIFREAVIAAYGSFTYEHTLRYIWNLGIPVLPLVDSGAFHGACWRIDGRNVIVLKQSLRAPARWLFDLLHEVDHAATDPDEPNFAVIEDNEMASARVKSPEEVAASQWAGDVILRGRAETLAQQCVTFASSKMEHLKQAVIEVAERENVRVDALANYLAFRLAVDGQNWWGAANNLQSKTPDPWVTARDVLLEHVNLSVLGDADRALLLQALTEQSSAGTDK
jgi:transcriptional regulator with XRE-family HTH domain